MHSVTTVDQEAEIRSQRAELMPLPKGWQRCAAYGALIVVLAFFAFVRVRLRTMPLERDEGKYAYAGQLLLRGIPPYKLAYSMKLPGTFYCYAAIMAIFGQTAAGIHVGVMLANLLASIFVFLLGKRLHGTLTGVLAGCTYALLSTRSSVLGLQGHATHFVVLAALAGILLLLRAIEKNRNIFLFSSGLALGFAFLMKQPGIVFAVFALLYWLWNERAHSFRRVAFGCAIFLSGVAAPFALLCLVLYRAGAFREFWFWTVSYARAYGSILSLRQGWRELRVVGPWVIRPFVLWEIALVGLTSLFWNEKVRERAGFSVGFLVFSLPAVSAGLYFRPHYFILMLPAIALWTGIGIAAAQEHLRSNSRLAWLPIIAFTIAFAFSIHGHWNVYFRLDPAAVYQREHDSQGLGCADGCTQDEATGQYIRAHSSEADDVAVLGSEPAIYFYAHRRPATGCIYMFPLTENQPFARSMQQQMLAEVEQNHPGILVYVDDGYSWQTDKGPPRTQAFLDRIQQFVRNGYDLEQQFPIPSDSWHRLANQSGAYIFRKKQ